MDFIERSCCDGWWLGVGEWGHALQHVEARRPFVCVLVAPPGGCEVCIKDRGSMKARCERRTEGTRGCTCGQRLLYKGGVVSLKNWVVVLVSLRFGGSMEAKATLEKLCFFPGGAAG